MAYTSIYGRSMSVEVIELNVLIAYDRWFLNNWSPCFGRTLRLQKSFEEIIEAVERRKQDETTRDGNESSTMPEEDQIAGQT